MGKFVPVLAAALLACSAGAAERPLTWGDEIVVTATRFKDRYVDTPVNVTVITGAEIRASSAKTVPELLAEQAGINVRDLFGNNATSATVDMRGFGAAAAQNTLILVDGRRAVDIDLSGVQWSALPLDAIERIEIVRGAGSVLYGDGATAGVVNIITRSPPAAGRSLAITATAGSYATTEIGLDGGYSGNRAAFHVNAANFESDGYRANNRTRQSNAQAGLLLLSERGEVVFKLGADRQGLRLPGARTVQPSAGVDELATDRRGTSTPLDYATRDGNQATVDWRRDTAFGEFNVGAGWRDKAQTSYFDFGGFPDFRMIDLEVRSFTPRLKIARPLAGYANTLVAGLDWYSWDYRLRRSNSVSNIGRPVNQVEATQENRALYLHNTTRFGARLTVSLGVRRERFAIDARDTYDPSAPGGAFGSGAIAGAQHEDATAYEAGARLALDASTAVIGKFGRSYRFANVDEIYETSPSFANEFQFLRPQTARTYEAGVETRSARHWLRATLFALEVNDEIHLDAYSAGIGNTNLPPSRRRGLELEGWQRVARGVRLGASYTYTDARFREGVLAGAAFTQQNVTIAGKTVPLVPRHKANLTASWEIDGATRVNAALTYVGAQFMDNDEGNTLAAKIPAYTVVDVKLAHRRGPWRASLAVSNLLNEKYYTYAVRSQFVADRYNAYPLPERHFTARLEYALR